MTYMTAQNEGKISVVSRATRGIDASEADSFQTVHEAMAAA